MATFLTREDIVKNLHRIIREASKELLLISPYIKVDDDTRKLLKKTTRGTAIHVIYGKSQSERNRSNVETSFDLPGIPVSFLKDLHAKCYLNEKEAIVTSMNLHEFSQEHNDEMGILVSRQKDADLYDAIYQEASRLKAESSKSATDRISTQSPKKSETRKRIEQNAVEVPERGFCIRCRSVIDVIIKVKPYCRECYKGRNKNDQHKEKHCHTCGEEHTTTLSKPLCRSCHAKYKDVLEFPAR